MNKYFFFMAIFLLGCHGRGNYLAIDDGMVLEKKSGDIYEIKPENNPPFRYIGNLNEFRRTHKKGCERKKL